MAASTFPNTAPAVSNVTFHADKKAWVPTTDCLSFIFDNPKYDQDKPVYIDVGDPSRHISCNQARKIVRQLTAGFIAAGVKKGDCVVVHAFNDIYYSMLFLGILGAGAIFAGTNPAYTQFELSHHLKTSKASFVLSEPEIFGSILKSAEELGIPHSRIRIFNPTGDSAPAGFRQWTELLQHGEKDWVRFDGLETSRNTTAARLFTSGTSGLPKAAVISHYNLVAQHMVTTELQPKPFEISGIIAIPSFHAASVPSTHVGALRQGATLYMMRRFDLKLYLEAFEKHQCTYLALVPPIVIAILSSPFAKTGRFLKSARQAVVGAAILDKESQNRFAKFLEPGVPFTQGWGMTEVTGAGTVLAWPEIDETGSVGRLLPGSEAKLIDADGRNISDYDVPGELCIRGPNIINGYFEADEANKEAFDSEGFLKTGDIFYCQKGTNKWYILDRNKELIKVRGFQVAPTEIESVLLMHPQIVDAAVIGIPAGNQGNEMPRAYVVRAPRARLTEEEVRAYAGSKLAKYKALDGGVKFLDSIPKNATGKILKRVLRETAKKELGGKL